MASSMSSGDRRWASARRGGMTVLGKVAVPKPINLPSQRQENHGLDPNVEIVPKGTLGWGSRPSSSTSNAWGSSSLSPNADSGSNSLGRLSARPSSGEAGTRPSTAGSDNVHDSTHHAWSSNSRPSSASGALTSSQASLGSLRPRSAEPRPGSSQLSRFAEPPSDISVVGSGERLVVTSSKNDGFSLSTGDFPSLGSVKSSPGKNTGSQDPALHDSGSAGGLALAKDGSENYSVGDASLSADGKSRTDDSWRKDNPSYGEDGHRVGIEKRNGDNPPFQNSGILPQHFNAWRGPPANNPPGGVWYRGPPGGPPPYGGPVPPGGFPMEPFHYYRPQIPPSALPNPQQVPPPGTGPRGPHPKSGDMYRPQMPDAYIRPGMPVRPGFYPGPVPYDGYIGPPPMRYFGPNERDISMMGMAGGPPSIYGQFPGHNAPDAGNSHIRPPGHGSNNIVRSSEEVESGHHRDPREPYRVLLKQHDNWNEKSEQQKQEETQQSSGPSMEKVDQSRASSWENECRVDSWKDEEKDLEVRAVGEGAASQNFGKKAGGSVLSGKVKLPKDLESARVDRDNARAEQKNFVTDSPKSGTPEGSSLIQKIEGLNAKARVSDPRHDVMVVSERPVRGNKWHIREAKSSHSAAEPGHHPPCSANVQDKSGLCTEEKMLEETADSGTNTSRRYPHSVRGKVHHQRGRGRFNPEDIDGFRKKPVALDPLLPIPSEASDVHRRTDPASQSTRKYEGGYVPVITGPGDSQAERAHAKMKEQRVKQRQNEEDELAREQKAKAQMKLEELNRRTHVVEGSNSKTESGILNNENKAIPTRSALSSSSPVSGGDLVRQTTEALNDAVGRSSGPSKEFPHEPQKGVHKEPAIVLKSVPLQQDAKFNADNYDVAPQTLKQHRTGYKQKQNMMSEKNNTQKIVTEAPKSQVVVADDVTMAVDGGADFSAYQRRRSNRGNRNKPKGDESSTANPLPLLAPKESGGVSTAAVEGAKLKASGSETDHSAVGTLAESNDENQLSEQCPGSANEEAHVRGNNQWKSQPSRRAPRNQNVNRVADKFHGGDAAVWAPVRTQHKTEVADGTSERTAGEGQSSLVKSDQPLQNNNPRSKRAELERYIPKPVAKEMAQQGSVHQQMAVLESQKKSADEAVQQGDTGSGSVAVKESSSRQNRSAKGHGSWHQRGTTDTVTTQGLPIEQSQSQSLHVAGNVQKWPEHQQGPKPEEKPTKEQPKHHDEGLSCDGANVPSESASFTSQFTAPAVRDQGIIGRGKRHPFSRGQKGRLDSDQNKSVGESEKCHNPSVAPEGSQTDPAAEGSHTDPAGPAPRESHGIVERSTLHWQPKSRAVPSQNYRANKAAGTGRNTAESSGVPVEEFSEEHDEARDPSVYVEDKMHEKAGLPEGSKRESRPRFLAGRPQSPSQGPLKTTESADEPHEAVFSSGPRKNGNQNSSRFVRRDEYHGEWNSSRQDTRQHNAPAHRERQRYNSSYKYQPVGIYGNENKPSHFEGLRDVSQSKGPRYKERAGQSGSRRGGGTFYERQGGNAHVD
ncbi:protein MODIFIER OF SNC1 1 isoform X1 [Punica granatum]|uniref:Protein MODIFIER OF SNC1 1 isoform X1 n=1 Tax=Punica granatum TaxID=22663 RepID=A0A218VZX1_PUNGR|nr:protein MODIFIER OF SNC1 1 isoform X1 [Punica granatum]OWM65432.1 hypothetical protein CDL15_Pgr009022 [Punica granatum]